MAKGRAESRVKGRRRSGSSKPNGADVGSKANRAVGWVLPDWRPILLLAVLATVVYANTDDNQLVYDDALIVEQNEVIRDPLNVRDIWMKAGWLPDRAGIVYRPLSLWSFAVNYRFNQWVGLAGTDVRTYHVFNLLLHAAVCCALFFLMLNLQIPHSASLLCACLFAVHPVHTEAVAGLIGRAEMLAFVFGMWFVMCHRKGSNLGLCGTLYLTAILGKESGFLFFPFAATVDLVMGGGYRRLPWRRYLVYGGIGITCLLARSAAWIAGQSKPVPFIDNPIVGMTWFRGLMTALSVQLEYLRTFVFPLPLSSDYSYNQLPIDAATVNNRVLVFVVVPIFAVWLSWRLRRAHPAVGLGVLGYAVLFGVTANIILPIGTIMGERLLYATSAMLCLLAGYGAWAASEKLKLRGGQAVPVVVLIACSALTIDRNTSWKDEMTFFGTQVETAPNSAKAYYEAAIASYRTSLGIFPYYAEPAYNLGNALRRTGAPVEDVAQAYRDAIRFDPGHRNARGNLAELLLNNGKNTEASNLIIELRGLDPVFPSLQYLEARLLQVEQMESSQGVPPDVRRGVLAYANGDYETAIEILEPAVKSQVVPENLLKTAFSLLVRSYEARGDSVRAEFYRAQAGAEGPEN